MAKRNAEAVVDYLFLDMPLPYDVLGQERCRVVNLPRGTAYQRGSKVLYMKVLSEGLFSTSTEGGAINAQNTLLIDDSPEKSICNETGNAIFLDSWTHVKRPDDVLKGELLPWLRRLHSDCPDGRLLEYVDEHRIGNKPLNATHPLSADILHHMRISANAMGSRYELSGLNLVIERGRWN